MEAEAVVDVEMHTLIESTKCCGDRRVHYRKRKGIKIMKLRYFGKSIVAATVLLLVSAAGVFAESNPSKTLLKLAPGAISASIRTDIAVPARHASAPTIFGAEPRFNQDPTPSLQRQATSRNRSIQRKVLGAIVGATAGFFAGGYLGAWIDGDCGGCDDPGLKGALIGAPVGAVTGGILGYKFIF